MNGAVSATPDTAQRHDVGAMPQHAERLSFGDMADDLTKMATSKSWWLEACSSGPKKRPDHELEIQRKHLAVLQQAADDYQRAADRVRHA